VSVRVKFSTRIVLSTSALLPIRHQRLFLSCQIRHVAVGPSDQHLEHFLVSPSLTSEAPHVVWGIPGRVAGPARQSSERPSHSRSLAFSENTRDLKRPSCRDGSRAFARRGDPAPRVRSAGPAPRHRLPRLTLVGRTGSASCLWHQLGINTGTARWLCSCKSLIYLGANRPGTFAAADR
jgi:hypothetical protein